MVPCTMSRLKQLCLGSTVQQTEAWDLLRPPQAAIKHQETMIVTIVAVTGQLFLRLRHATMAGMLSFCSSVILCFHSCHVAIVSHLLRETQKRHSEQFAADAAKSVSEGKMRLYEHHEMPNNNEIHATCSRNLDIYICMYACNIIMYLPMSDAFFENQLTQHPALSCHFVKPKTPCYEVFWRTSRSRGGVGSSQSVAVGACWFRC